MAVTQSMPTVFKTLLLTLAASDTYKLALYTDAAVLGPDTTAYTATGEVADAAYTAGGQELTGVTVGTEGTVSWLQFADATWSGVITARAGLIYNVTRSNCAVGVLDFGATKTSAVEFVVQMPASGPTTALLRIV